MEINCVGNQLVYTLKQKKEKDTKKAWKVVISRESYKVLEVFEYRLLLLEHRCYQEAFLEGGGI